jgi:Putative cyclase
MAYVMGVESPRAFFASYLDYTLADGIAEQITCPTLAADAGTAGRRANGVQHYTGKIVTPGVFVDLAAHRGVDTLDPGYAITTDDLDEYLATKNLEIRPGDALIGRTGFMAARRGNWGDYAGGPSPGLSSSPPAPPSIGPCAAGVFANVDAADPSSETAADGGLVESSGEAACRSGDGGKSHGGKVTHADYCGGKGSWRPMQISVQLGPPEAGDWDGHIGS